MTLKLAGKKVLAHHLSANIVWDDEGNMTAASLAFDNILLSPELRAMHIPDPTLPSTTLHTSLDGLDPAKVLAWRNATIALFEDELNYGQLQGVTKE